MSRFVLVPSSRIPSVATASLVPSLQKGREWARSLHVSINGGALLLFGWQAFTGIAIVQKLLSAAASPTSLASDAMTSITPSQRLARLAFSTLLLLLVGVGLLTAQPSAARAAEASPAVDSAALSKAVLAMEQLDQMRVSLASTLEGSTEEPTIETMKEVCKPVGMRAIAIGKENGWQVRQVATKYRNPGHTPANAQERQVIDLFSRHPEINGLWEPAVAEQGAGLNYYRRINVEPSCLACHGTKASRPAFVKANYPDDKAFDFKVGDLRGMYAVHLPEVQAALAAAAG